MKNPNFTAEPAGPMTATPAVWSALHQQFAACASYGEAMEVARFLNARVEWLAGAWWDALKPG